MLPALHTKDVVGAVTIYSDVDGGTVFYAPTLFLEPLKEQDLGPKKSLAQGGGAYGLSASDRAAIQSRYPNALIAPLPVDDAQIKDNFAELLKGHAYTIRILPQIPYPKFIFSATLDKDATNYSSVMAELRSRWLVGDFFHSALVLRFPAQSLEISFDVHFSNSRLRQVREATLPLKNLTYGQIVAFLGRVCKL